MTGKFIAVANMKGGVGKTTTVVSLAEALAADDPKAAVLVVDLDPQASASLCLAGDDVLADLIENGRTLQDFLEMRLFGTDRKQKLSDFIRSHYSYTLHRNNTLNIALLPCGPRLRTFEREILYKYAKQNYGMKAVEGHLWQLFKAHFNPLRDEYAFIIFDCPPGISPFTEVAIKASDMTIVPTIPDRISNFGLNAFCEEIWRSTLSSLPTPAKPFVLATRVQHHVTQHKTMLERFEVEAEAEDAASRLLRTRIPQAAALADALVADKMQTFSQKYRDGVVGHLASLTREIKEVFEPIEIDGKAVLGAIVRHAQVFAALKPEVIKTAKGFVSKQLKDKALTREALMAVATARGAEDFDLIVDAMSDAEVKALLGKVDKLNAAIKAAPAAGQRKLLGDLAHGRAEPTAKPPAAPIKSPPAREARPKVERSGNSKAMRAKKKV